MKKYNTEIKSPRSLPKGITADEYENGEISCLRNPILGNVFFRMKYIEMFGTDVRRFKFTYKNKNFEILDALKAKGYIKVIGNGRNILCKLIFEYK